MATYAGLGGPMTGGGGAIAGKDPGTSPVSPHFGRFFFFLWIVGLCLGWQ
jgi:hypothetical protein